MRRTKQRQGERGVEIVEFAVVLPLILFLSLAVSEGAAMIRAHQVLNNAAREGARLAVLPENSPQNMGGNGGTLPVFIANQVQGYINDNGVSGTGSGQCVPQVAGRQNLILDNGNGDGVNLTASQVTITCPYTLKYLPHIPGFGINPTVNLQGSAVFRNFY
jgi:Flp pilus assembly protein TadG